MKKISIQYRKTGDLIPYPNNARTHTDAHIEQISVSMREFGWTNPIILDGDNGILAGHGRLAAAVLLGFKEVPTVDVSGLTDAQKRAYVLADNKIAENAGWDIELLRAELGELHELDFDLGLIGFSEQELAGHLDNGGGLTDPDQAPEPPDDPITKLGDVWLLGNHRIVCGDSTDADTVAKCMNGVEPHLMVTDPPYGVEYDPEWRVRLGVNMKNAAHGKVLNDDKDDWFEAWSLFPGDVAYVWHGVRQCPTTAIELERCNFELRALIVWAKNHAPMSRGDYHHQHETCWYAVRKNKKGHYCGGRKQTTLWQIDKPMKSETGHSTQKPIECMKRPIENNSSVGQAVYEPFAGSGTTIIAAEMTGRVCHAIELSPAYVDVCVNRWEDFTGNKATLEGEDVKAAA